MWMGTLNSIDKLSGYWLKLNDEELLTYESYPNESTLQYSLSQGANLISFPSDMTYGCLLYTSPSPRDRG